MFANISSQIALTNDNFQLQAHVAELVSQLMNPNNSTPVTASVGVSGLVFGYSDADVIDTFADVSLNFSPGAAVRRLKDEFSKTVYDYFNGKDVNLGFGDIEWQITKSIVSLAEENVVLTDAAIALPGLNRFYFNIPFINFQASLYNGNVASVKVANMMLVNGVLTSMTYITFVNDNPALMQRILTMSTNLIFWRWKLEPERQDRPVAAGGGGMMFGSSESHAYTLASTAAIDLDVTFVIDRLGDAMANPDDPLVKLADIDAELNYKGLDTRIYMNNLPTWLPLDLKIGGLHGRLTHTTAEDYNTPVYELADAYFYDFVLEPGKAISCGLLIIPAVEQLQKPLEIAVPLLLSWNSYSHYAKLGYASLTEFDTRPFWVREDPSAPQDPVPTGKRLSILTDAFFDAPDLYLWQPVQLTNISWINPFSEHLVKISAVFPNPGPLNVDAGRLTWDIMGSFNTKLVELATTNNIVVQSRLHGGNDIRSNPKNLEVLVSYNFWGGLASFNPMFVYNLWRSLIDGDQAALERLNHITIYRDGGARPGPIAWLNRVAEMVLKPSVENMAQITCSLYHKAQEWKSLTYDTDGSVTGNFTYDPLPRKHYSRGDAFDCAWKFVFGESQEISDVDVRMPGAWPTGSSSSDQASSSSSTMATGTITSSASTMAATVVSTTSEIRLPGAWPSSAFSSSNHNNNHKTLVRRRRVNIK